MNPSSIRSSFRQRRAGIAVLLAALALLASCGGGGGLGDGDQGGGLDAFGRRTEASDKLAQICAIPRSGRDPYNDNQPYPDVAGTLEDEKDWLATYLDEVYLWYREIPNVDARPYTTANYGSPANAMAAYFDAQLTPQRTASGKLKDQFSFIYPTDDWNALSQSGIEVGYGMLIALLQTSPPREAVIAYTTAGTPAASGGIVRGARIVTIDGEDVAYGDDVDTLSAGLFPQAAGEQHVFGILDPGAGTPRNVTLTAQSITSAPVPTVSTIDTASGRVGYLLFNDHVATAERALYDAVNTLSAAGISDLVLDLRYNGGGYLDIAGELAYMIAGSARTSGRVFERLQFNDKNPLGDEPDAETPFHAVSLGFDSRLADGTALPSLNLARVFVLAGPGTCSASEAIVNGLRGVDVDVVLIGDTTCGKPYGFYAWDNCGTSYFAIEFEGVNQKGQGGYADGMAATCGVEDDFAHALGDPAEARFATALAWRDGEACMATAKAAQANPPVLLRSVLRENAWRSQPAR